MSLKQSLILIIFVTTNGDDSFVSIPNKIRFPYGPVQGPFIGIFLAISLPLELPDYNVFFSYNFEANYVLPSNQTEFTYPPLISKRSIRPKGRFWDRKYFYDIIEFKIKSHGYPGKYCLLRAICENALYSPENTGILGDLIHILLTPSSSAPEYLLEDYSKAERYGRLKKNCESYEKKCPMSFLNLISKILLWK